MRVRTYLNEGPGAFTGYRDGEDALVAGPVLSIEADDPDDALDEAWQVGNRMGADQYGQIWPAMTRSMSVGDVALIGSTAYACESLGWRPVRHISDVMDSLTDGDRLPRFAARVG